MAAQGWRTTHPLETVLFEKGYSFDFFQAVKMLEIIKAGNVPVGDGSDPRKEAVRFESTVGFDFPASDVLDIKKSAWDDEPAKMTINFFGLAGLSGPLPAPYTDLICQRTQQKDTALRDFLDIFNHRLISLFYRVRKIFRLGFEVVGQNQNRFAGIFFSLMGLGTGALRGRMQIDDTTLLPLTSFFSQNCRSMSGLETVLRNLFKAPVKGRQFCGQWLSIENDSVTRIGLKGKNNRLSASAVIGKRIWDQQSKFEIVMGPLEPKQFTELLPNGSKYPLLCETICFYATKEYDFDIVLLLSDENLFALGNNKGPRLGWTSWLGDNADDVGHRSVRLSSRKYALTAAARGEA